VDRPIEARLAAAGLPALPRTAWLEIDLGAIVANLAVVRSIVGPDVRVEPVLKADAYGHGALPVALALEAAGADGFCVAAYDEAVELRRGGVRRPILVLYAPDATLAGDAAARRISLSVGDPDLMGRLLAELGTRGRGAARLRLELEVETGLGRNGFGLDAVVDAARAVAAAPGVALSGLWTHLQAAEDAPRTASQFARFEAALAAVRAAGLDPGRRHIVASGGLAVGGLAAYDVIRPGLVTFGIVPDAVGTGREVVDLRSLRPALSLKARPVRVVDLPAGWGISYGPTFETRRPSRIATLPLGYGDGWSRALSNRAEVLVRGTRAPLIGNVSMDAVMVDVTDVPGSPVTVDDEFVFIGRQGDDAIAAVDVARRLGTISWEIVTAMSRRLPRVYDALPGAVGLRTLIWPGTTWHASSSGTATSATWRSTRS
jgi:alanine racemase